MERKMDTEKENREKQEWNLPKVKEVGLPETDGKVNNTIVEQHYSICGPAS